MLIEFVHKEVMFALGFNTQDSGLSGILIIHIPVSKKKRIFVYLYFNFFTLYTGLVCSMLSILIASLHSVAGHVGNDRQSPTS